MAEKPVEIGPIPENIESAEQALHRQNQENADELLNAKIEQNKPFQTDAKKQELADEFDRIIQPETAKPSTEDVHYEAGGKMPLPFIIKTEAEKAAAITKLMNSSASPFEMQGALSEALEDQDLPKAA
jgi:hypothetical protein